MSGLTSKKWTWRDFQWISGAFCSQGFCNKITVGLWCVVTVSQGACHGEEWMTAGFVNIYSKASSLKQSIQWNIKKQEEKISFHSSVTKEQLLRGALWVCSSIVKLCREAAFKDVWLFALLLRETKTLMHRLYSNDEELKSWSRI